MFKKDGGWSIPLKEGETTEYSVECNDESNKLQVFLKQHNFKQTFHTILRLKRTLADLEGGWFKSLRRKEITRLKAEIAKLSDYSALIQKEEGYLNGNLGTLHRRAMNKQFEDKKFELGVKLFDHLYECNSHGVKSRDEFFSEFPFIDRNFDYEKASMGVRGFYICINDLTSLFKHYGFDIESVKKVGGK